MGLQRGGRFGLYKGTWQNMSCTYVPQSIQQQILYIDIRSLAMWGQEM